MRPVLLVTLLGLSLGLQTAAAQPPAPTTTAKTVAGLPVENVIVTAPAMRPEAMLNDFIAGHTTPAPMVGKIARWRSGICPITLGLPERYRTYITQRIIKVAMMAGAPLDSREPCYPNLAVVATDRPQELLGLIRAKYPALIGRPRTRDTLGGHLHEQAMSADAQTAILQRPIQAWYLFVMEDYWGMIRSIAPAMNLEGDPLGAEGIPGGVHVSGNRAIGDGLKEEFQFGLIIVDSNKIAGQEIGPLADYVAMLSLSQGREYDVCQPVPTITNLLAENCDPGLKPAGLTDIDLTYLRGLYKMDAGRSFIGERASIAYEIKKDLGGY